MLIGDWSKYDNSLGALVLLGLADSSMMIE